MVRSSRWKSVQERIERRRKPTAVKPKKMYNRPQSTPETAARMRAAKAAKRSGQAEINKPSIVDFVTRDLGLSPSEYQLTLLKSFYGLPLSDRELGIWGECTGRSEYPGKPFVELTLVSGARSGKNAYVMTPVLLYEAVWGGFRVNPGETVAVPLIAQDATACDVSMRLMREYARKLGGGTVVDETARKLALKNGIEVRLYPCTSKSLYGVSICGAGLDEVGRFKWAGADTDEDIEAGVLRGMGQFENRAKLIVTSTPSGKQGLLWRNFERSWGKPDPVRLVWRSTSAMMAPAVNSPAFLERMKSTMDPVRYARLFDAEFSEDAGVFLSVDVVERATDWSVTERTARDFAPGTRFIAFCDPAGHGRDEFTLAVIAVVGEGAERKFVQAVMWSAPKKAGAVKDTDAWVGLACSVLDRFKLSRVYGDRATGGWVLDAFKRRGVTYEYPHLRRDERDVAREMRDRQAYATRSMLYLEAGVAVRSGAVRLLDDQQLRRELTNLEQSGDRVEPGPMHDDRANAVMGAVAMGLQLGLGLPRPLAFALDRGGPGGGSTRGSVDTGWGGRVGGQAAAILRRYSIGRF
jgi:hypothetical protein